MAISKKRNSEQSETTYVERTQAYVSSKILLRKFNPFNKSQTKGIEQGMIDYQFKEGGLTDRPNISRRSVITPDKSLLHTNIRELIDSIPPNTPEEPKINILIDESKQEIKVARTMDMSKTDRSKENKLVLKLRKTVWSIPEVDEAKNKLKPNTKLRQAKLGFENRRLNKGQEEYTIDSQADIKEQLSLIKHVGFMFFILGI